MAKRRKRRFSPFLLVRLLGIGLFIFILTTIDLGELWENIRTTRVDFFLYALAFQLLLLMAKALRWHLMNNGSRSMEQVIRSFGEFLESYAVGVITPGRLGELMKAGHATGKKRVLETGFRILIERGLDIGFFVIIAGAAFMFAYTGLITSTAGIIILVSGAAIFLLSMMLMKSRAALRAVQKALNSIPYLKLDMELSFHHIGNLNYIWVVLLSLISNFSAFVSCYMLALGLDFELSFLFISGGIAIAGLLNMLPVTVMGLGTREGTFLLLFKPMAEPLILAFSGLVFLVAQLGGGIMALLLGQLFLYHSRTKNKNAS
jgi:uncharacterized membrane protein YbhN (UPF0104 family)